MKTQVLRHFPVVAGLVVLALGLCLPVSCTKEVFNDFEDDDPVVMTITVGGNTKTENDGNSTLWTEDDDLTVIHASSTASAPSFWPSYFYFSGPNAFTGTVNRLSATNDWYAVYPYADIHHDATALSLSFPSSQIQEGNASRAHLAGESFPLYGVAKGMARSSELSISMKNLLAVAKFNVTNGTDTPVTIKEIEYTASSPIAGTFSVNLTGDVPVFNNGSGKTVKLNVQEGTSIDAGTASEFYMAIAPYEASAGSKRLVKVVAEVDGSDIPCYLTFTDAIVFKSGVIKNINFTFDLDHKTKPDMDGGSAGEVVLPVGGEPDDGVYLLVYKNGDTSMAFAAFDDYQSQKYAIPVTVVDNQVLPQEDIELSRFAITIEKEGIEHPNDPGHDAYNVKNSDGKFIFYASGGSGDAILRIQDTNTLTNASSGNTVAYYHTFIQTADGVQILSSGSESGYNQYLLAYSDANGFYYEKNNEGQKLHLYRLGGSAKDKQTLTFSLDHITYNFDTNGVGTLSGAPTLSGVMTTVSWSSSNTSVATVDANGSVTIHGPGIAVITAKAEANETYYAGSASYTIEVTSSSIQTWYKADEMEAGKQYLIVSNGYALQNNNGSIASQSVTVSNDIITMTAPADLLWTANSNNQLTTTTNNNIQYLGSTTSSSGGGFPGFGGTPNLSIGSQSNARAWTYDADNSHLTCIVSSSYGFGDSTYYLYYSSSNGNNKFTLNSSEASNHVAELYSTERPATKQTLSFEKSTDRWYVGEGGDHEIGRTYYILQLDGAYTEVTYTSSNPQVAEIVNNSQIKVKALGSTKITATATAGTVNGIEYKEGSVSYTLYIKEPVSGEWIELEGSPFNLENADVKAYLDATATSYTGSSISSTIVGDYAPGGRYSTITSKTTDYGQPVTIDWGTQSSGTATITILADDKETEVWTQTASSGSTSSKVYNLIPGETYYCTVEDNTGYLLKGVFETTGRRRMIKISEGTTQDYARNCRDLGGMVTADGTKRIKYGMIYRGTNLDATSDTEQNLMANYLNIGWDLDLRGTNEGKGEAFAKKYGAQYVHGEFSASVSSMMSSSKLKDVVRGFFNAATAGKASYFHCRIGSDRTGFWGLLIEGLLGVDVQECSKDYELTSFANNISGLSNRTRNSGLFSDGVSAFNKYDGNTLQDKIISYLTSVGITTNEIEDFQNAVLEDL